MLTLPYRQNGSVIATRFDSPSRLASLAESRQGRSEADGEARRARADGKVLIVRKPRPHHAWQFPQGGVETGEDARTAALREFSEELGTDKIQVVGKECGIFQYDWPEAIQRERGFSGQIVHFFRAEFLGADADIHLQVEELDDFRWVSAEELKNYFEDQDYLKTVLQILGSRNT